MISMLVRILYLIRMQVFLLFCFYCFLLFFFCFFGEGPGSGAFFAKIHEIRVNMFIFYCDYPFLIKGVFTIKNPFALV